MSDLGIRGSIICYNKAGHGPRCAQYAFFSPSKMTRDGRTDTTSYRDATAHLKIDRSETVVGKKRWCQIVNDKKSLK